MRRSLLTGIGSYIYVPRTYRTVLTLHAQEDAVQHLGLYPPLQDMGGSSISEDSALYNRFYNAEGKRRAWALPASFMRERTWDDEEKARALEAYLRTTMAM